MRAYLAALEDAHGEAPEAAEWIAWIRKHVDQLDPLSEPPGMPAVPEPGPEDLEAFMTKGMSPYGPSRW